MFYVCFDHVINLYVFKSCLVGNKIFGSSHLREIFVTKFITRKVGEGFNIYIAPTITSSVPCSNIFVHCHARCLQLYVSAKKGEG